MRWPEARPKPPTATTGALLAAAACRGAYPSPLLAPTGNTGATIAKITPALEAPHPVQPRHGHKNMWIRTKPLRHELGDPKDKNKKGLDDPPIMSLTSSSSS